ncbi:MAG: ABC transporter ATP-binding protein, partial [Planctomycetota bacterium]
MTALSPVHTIGNQICEAINLHQDVSHREAEALAVEMLGMVGIPGPAQRIRQYPHELSGGMRQRVVIAMALVCRPRLLIADEPTTALDVTIQAQILGLIRKLQRDLGTAVLLITHDLGVVAQTADDVVVMYLGRVVERGPVRRVLKQPEHPYTKALLDSLPSLHGHGERLPAIAGSVPMLTDIPPGCPFHPRCPVAEAGICNKGLPPALRDLGADGGAACVKVEPRP